MKPAIMTREGRVILSDAPEVGDRVDFSFLGEFEVDGLYHTSRDNFIRLRNPDGAMICKFDILSLE